MSKDAEKGSENRERKVFEQHMSGTFSFPVVKAVKGRGPETSGRVRKEVRLAHSFLNIVKVW